MSLHTISTPILTPSTPISSITEQATEPFSFDQLPQDDVFTWNKDNTSDVADSPKPSPAPEPATEPFSFDELSQDKEVFTSIEELFRYIDGPKFDEVGKLPSSVTTPTPDYKPVSFDTLFPADLKEVHFKQQDIGDCYLLAAVDSLFHHPDGAAWLRKIKFEAIEDADKKITKYKVTFPSGFRAEFDADEVGKPKSGKRPVEGPLGVQLLELAFAKSTRACRNAFRFSNFGVGNTVHILEGGSPYEALHYMFNGENISLSAIPATPMPSGMTIEPTDPFSANPNGLKMLKDLLRQIEDDKTHTTLISANTPAKSGTEGGIRITLDNGTKQMLLRDHTYSIRGFNLDHETITIANPHDTKTRVATLSFKEFIQAFNYVNGVKLPKSEAAA